MAEPNANIDPTRQAMREAAARCFYRLLELSNGLRFKDGTRTDSEFECSRQSAEQLQAHCIALLTWVETVELTPSKATEEQREQYRKWRLTQSDPELRDFLAGISRPSE